MKPVVHYRGEAYFVEVGANAMCFPIDHPAHDRVSNTKLIITSPVVRVGENGEFETQNTVYQPESK